MPSFQQSRSCNAPFAANVVMPNVEQLKIIYYHNVSSYTGIALLYWRLYKLLLAVDHSARTSMKSAANCVTWCELQDTLIIDILNATGGQDSLDSGCIRLRVGCDKNTMCFNIMTRLSQILSLR
jgi:hypothetical protein